MLDGERSRGERSGVLDGERSRGGRDLRGVLDGERSRGGEIWEAS